MPFFFFWYSFCRQPVPRHPARHPRPAQTPAVGETRRAAAPRVEPDRARLRPPLLPSRQVLRHEKRSALRGGRGGGLSTRRPARPRHNRSAATHRHPWRPPRRRARKHTKKKKRARRDACQRGVHALGGGGSPRAACNPYLWRHPATVGRGRRAAGALPAHHRRTRRPRLDAPCAVAAGGGQNTQTAAAAADRCPPRRVLRPPRLPHGKRAPS